ncbi:MAG: hypothetical protein ACKOBW_16080 [Planctomycetota bacterium]
MDFQSVVIAVRWTSSPSPSHRYTTTDWKSVVPLEVRRTNKNPSPSRAMDFQSVAAPPLPTTD